jgi:hypothetical protein
MHKTRHTHHNVYAMGMIQNIREYFHQRFLKEALQKPVSAARKRVNLNTSKTIGILFDATDHTSQTQVMDYADALRLSGKRVHLLGAVDTDHEDGSFPFPSFSRKQIDWALRPKGRAVDQFLETEFDLLVHLNSKPKLVLDFIALQAKAHLKVGPFLDQNIYDLMIDNPSCSIPEFIREMETLLHKTNTNQYAFA